MIKHLLIEPVVQMKIELLSSSKISLDRGHCDLEVITRVRNFNCELPSGYLGQYRQLT